MKPASADLVARARRTGRFGGSRIRACEPRRVRKSARKPLRDHEEYLWTRRIIPFPGRPLRQTRRAHSWQAAGGSPGESATVLRKAGSRAVVEAEPKPADADAQLMLQLGAGNREAFDRLFASWAGPLLRYLERMMPSRAIAEELMQETFLRVYRARERYRVEARFSTWLFTIATRVALNELRRLRGAGPTDSIESTEVSLSLTSPESPPDVLADARRRGVLVDGALQTLPERQRVALWLAAAEGFSYAEIAAAMETSESSVKALVHRGRSAVLQQVRESEGAGRND